MISSEHEPEIKLYSHHRSPGELFSTLPSEEERQGTPTTTRQLRLTATLRPSLSQTHHLLSLSSLDLELEEEERRGGQSCS